MKVLFISSENRGFSPIVISQGKSLRSHGIDIIHWGIRGKGLIGYLMNIPRLASEVRKLTPDVIHSHYSLCGVIASISSKRPVICSLMGSDVKKGSLLWHQIIKWFISKKWTATIVKSDDMKECLGISQLLVIPNGVDLRLFRPMDSAECRVKINWPLDKKIVVFAADPSRREKNYSLAEEAVKHIKRDDVLLKVANNVQHSDMPLYLNAADILVLTSSWEGSPNVVKEAMSCNTKIVAVKVGDIPWLLDGLENCYVTSHDPEDIASKIKQALDFRDKTKGRERLIELGLDSESVARRIVNVYERLMKEREL